MKAWEYRLLSIEERIWGRMIIGSEDECHLFTGAKNRFGYGQVKDKGKGFMVHRWVWEQTNGPIPAGLCILHSCDTPACANIKHLRLGSHDDNMQDKKDRGRGKGINKGFLHPRPNAKVTEQDVIAIKVGLASGKKQIDMAKRFGVSRNLISEIYLEKTWQHLNIHVCR